MGKILRDLSSTPRQRLERAPAPEKPAPGPVAGMAHDFMALDAVHWARARRRPHPAETEPK